MPKILFSSPKGMKDILPQKEEVWKKIYQSVEKVAEAYDFHFIETPILEKREIFLRGVGEGTEVVSKQMYSLTTKGKEKLVLRPEGTAPICRSYIEHGMASLPQPVKLYYYGPFFRYERPQRAREREFHQFGFEVLGAKDPFYDALVILIFTDILRSLKLKNFVIKINSIGCRKCRKKYLRALKRYYRPYLNYLCSDCQRRFEINPLRLLDCKEEKCSLYKKGAPIILDFLCKECKEHFKSVLEFLDYLSLPYCLDHTLVRGLDYYTNTVFEVFLKEEKEKEFSELSLGGGGRYNELIKFLGGGDVAGVGFGGGIERIIEAIEVEDIKIKKKPKEIFLVALGEEAKREILAVWEEIRKAGFRAAEAIEKGSISAQLKAASKYKVKFALILGQREAVEKTILIKDMESGIQEEIPQKKLIKELKKRIK